MLQGRRLITIIIAVLPLIQCANIFEPLSPKDTNSALLYEAKLKIDARKYDEALTALGEMDPDYAAQKEVLVTYASAYAGACGMEFISFFNSISNANLSSSTLFKYLRSSFTDKAATPAQCVEAEKKLKAIGATADLRLAAMNGSKEVNMLMAILAMAKIGAYLRTKSDIDGTNSLGDGTTDATFDSCSNAAANLTDDEVVEVATGFDLLIENLPSLLGATNTVVTTLNTAVSGVIGVICDLAPTTKCVALDKSDIAPADKAEFVDTYRDLLKSAASGLEACANVDVDTCCP